MNLWYKKIHSIWTIVLFFTRLYLICLFNTQLFWVFCINIWTEIWYHFSNISNICTLTIFFERIVTVCQPFFLNIAHHHDHAHDAHGGHGVDPFNVRPLDRGPGSIGAVWDGRSVPGRQGTWDTRNTHIGGPLGHHGGPRRPLDGLNDLRSQFNGDFPAPHAPLSPHLGPQYNDIRPRKYDGRPDRRDKKLRKNKRKLQKKIRKAMKKHRKNKNKILRKELKRNGRKGRRQYGKRYWSLN